MGMNQRSLSFLAFKNELENSVIHTSDGVFRVVDFLNYDSMTHSFLLRVENVDTHEISVRECSDKHQYDVEEVQDKERPNKKRLKPKERNANS